MDRGGFASLLLVGLLALLSPGLAGQVQLPYDPTYGQGINWNGFGLARAANGQVGWPNEYPVEAKQLDDGNILYVGYGPTMRSIKMDANGFPIRGYARFGAISDTVNRPSISISSYTIEAHIYVDGGYLALFASRQLFKFNAEGFPDVDFGNAGRLDLGQDSLRFWKLQVAPDGRITLGGHRLSDKSLCIKRLLPNGDPDPSLGNNGLAIHSEVQECKKMQLLPDGRIFCHGANPDSPTGSVFTMLGPDGQLDTTFMAGGLSGAFTPELGTERISLAHVASDGKLLVVHATMDHREKLVRLLPTGELDDTFQPVTRTKYNWFQLMEDGSIFYSADLSSRLGRMSPDGELDHMFGHLGVVDIPGCKAVRGVTPTAQGLLAYGSLHMFYDESGLALFRLQENGDLDSTFAYNGRGYYEGHSASCGVIDLAVDNRDRVMGCWGRPVHEQYQYTGNSWLVRLDEQGLPDTSFGANGVARPMTMPYTRMLPLDDGNSIGFYMYKLDNSSDYNVSWNVFDTTGVMINGMNGWSTNNSLLMDVAKGHGERIYYIVKGKELYLGREFTEIGCVRPDGSLDSTFAVDGRFLDPPTPLLNHGHCIDVFPNGDVLAVQTVQDSLNFGIHFNKVQLRRLSPDGVPVTSWGMAGKIRTDINGTAAISAEPMNLAMIPDGGFYLLYRGQGNDTTLAYLAKYMESGALDTGFGNNGVVAVGKTDYGEWGLVVQANGKITISMPFVGDDYWHRNYYLSRYLPDGAMDTTFGDSGQMMVGAEGGLVPTYVNIVLDRHDNILVSGSMNSDPRWKLSDWFVLRLMDDLPTAVADASPVQETGQQAVRIYPNPAAKGDVRIKYTLDKAAHVVISSIDARGRVLAKLVDGIRPKGEQDELLRWPGDLPGGACFIRIDADGWSRTVPFILAP